MKKTSCLLLTYNRITKRKHLLEESIESFLRQDYPNRELIIVNDHPAQVLVCDRPGVKIFNLSERFKSLGEKYNFAARACQGELLCSWEDDDISLPNRLSSSVQHIGDFGYFNPRYSWFMDGNGLHSEHGQGYNHNCSMFTREAFEAVGGYDHISGAQDAMMDGKLKRHGSVSPVVLRDPAQWFFIYRFGVSDVHLSGFSEPDRAYADYGKREATPGTHVLKPYWRMDYSAQCANHLDSLAAKG